MVQYPIKISEENYKNSRFYGCLKLKAILSHFCARTLHKDGDDAHEKIKLKPFSNLDFFSKSDAWLRTIWPIGNRSTPTFEPNYDTGH